jgi:hypothetical protein
MGSETRLKRAEGGEVIMAILDRRIVKRVRNTFTKGTAVIITADLDDPYKKVTAGTRGTVKCVDDNATVFVELETGEHIGLLYGIDRYRENPKRNTEKGNYEDNGTD